MTYLDVQTDTVAASGRYTAATAGDWQSWGHAADTALREAATVVADATVSSAVEGYAADWNPKIQSLAIQVDALGHNTTSASNVVVNADHDANALLTGLGARDAGLGGHLRRPITA